MAVFDKDTALEGVGENRFTGMVDAGWNISDNPNGGYLLSLVTSAIDQTIKHPDPLSVTAHYLRPGIPDAECEIVVDIIRTGRSITTVRARLVQEAKERLEVIAAYGDLGVSAGVDSDITVNSPKIPGPELCVPRTGNIQGIDLAIMNKLQVMLHPEQAAPGLAGSPEIAGWIRFADDREPDTRALLLFCDSFPPSPFGLLGVVGWVPTIELTVHIRRRPAPGWIQGQFKTDDLVDGRMIESGRLWDSTGSLVAECRQIGLVLNRD